MLLSRIPILLLSLIPSTLATQLVLTIPSSPQLPNPSVLPSSTYATLSTLSSVYTAPLSYTNAFSFRNLTHGSYLLTVSSPTHNFVPYRIDIHVPLPNSDTPVIEAFTTFRGNEWSNKGESITIEKIGEDKFKAEVKVLGEKGYYIERVGFSPLSLLKNPMILLAGFSMVIVFGMPYLMDNMDPELKAEFEERHKGGLTGGGANPANPLQNFDAAAWLAGSSGGKKSEGSTTPAERGITR